MRLPIQVQGILFRKINGKIQYLLLKRIEEGFWQPVTGGIEEGETKIEALKREVREETGIKNIVGIMKEILYDEFRDFFKREGCQRLIKEFAFGVEVSSNDKIVMSREHSEYRWCGFEEALKLLKWEGNKEALEKLNEILSRQK